MSQIYSRVITSWRTTSIGLAGTAVATYLFSALGCRWPEPQEWVLVIAPAVWGIITKEREASK